MDFKDECFNILNVAEKCNIPFNKTADRRSTFLGKCPFCEGKSYKLSLALETSDGRTNVFRCAKCGASGSSTKLYAMMKGIDTKQAIRELKNGVVSLNTEIRQAIVDSFKIPECLDTANIEKLDKVYRAFLNKLNITQSSYNNLKGRGVTDEFIFQKGYKSIPLDYKENLSICDELIKEGYDLEGVAGFYKNDYGNWTFSNTQGYLIPMKDINGKIASLQLRRDEKTKSGLRYTYFSSSKKSTGAKALAIPHVVYGNNSDEIYVTEGPLKADISSSCLDTTFISIPGVNSAIDILIDYIVALNPKKVILAFDMDFKTNIAVKKALIKISRLIKLKGFNVEIKLWDDKFKGIDDFLMNNK